MSAGRDTSTWMLTHTAFDTQTGTWRLRGERVRPPIDESERFVAIGSSFTAALADWEKQARARDRADD